MSSAGVHGFFNIKADPKVTSPQPTYQKDKSGSKPPQSLNDVGILPDMELESLASGKNHGITKAPGSQTPATENPPGVQTPKTPNELEMSRPPTPRRDDAVGLMRTWNSPPMTKWRILSCCLIYLCNGINDSGTYFTQ